MNNKVVKILVVEDYSITQKIIQLLLEDKFCVIDFVETGQQALFYFKKTKYDLIFVDIGLPDLNGLDVCEIIRKTNFCIPIFIISAYSNIEYKEKAMQLGINNYIEKPLTAEKLQTIWQQYISNLQN